MLSEAQLTAAARLVCELREVDPDGPAYDTPHRHPYLALIVDKIREHEQLHAAVAAVAAKEEGQ